MRRLIQTIALCFVAAIVAASLLAQAVGRGTVSGRVTDANNNPLPRALVAVTSDVAPSYKETVTANDAGDFTVSNVPSGPIRASAVTSNGVVRATAVGTLTGNNGSVVVAIKIPAGK
jgi:hypothetical protein